MEKLFVRHRVNEIKELPFVDKKWGVEIDLRSSVQTRGAIHLSHDPWRFGDDLELWLKEFKRLEIQGPIWLNTKEDGLEDNIEELMGKYGVKNYLFLDTVLPTLVKKTHFQNNKKFAVRFSAYEPLEFVNAFRDKVDWVWLDCFQGVPVQIEKVEWLKKNFRVCLVSPELHGKPLRESINPFLPLFELCDAICTKEPKIWHSFL